MWFLIEGLQIAREFILAGGPVLVTIAVVTWFMWTLLLERIWFLNISFPALEKQAIADWQERTEYKSWYAHHIRDAKIAELKIHAQYSINIIKACIALCPMLGLLGTVSGSIEVFDSLAIFGSGNTRSMAAGVSKATIPTMAGMVSALSGLITVSLISRKADRVISRLALNLTIEK